MNITFELPLGGYSEGANVENLPSNTTGDMNNVRPQDTLSGRLRIGQRPGLGKAFTQQIASASGPVVVLGSVSVVEYLGTD